MKLLNFYFLNHSIKLNLFLIYLFIYLFIFFLFSVSLLSGTDELQSSLLGAEQACGAFINQLDSVLKLLGQLTFTF